jgi:hypothetical protein
LSAVFVDKGLDEPERMVKWISATRMKDLRRAHEREETAAMFSLLAMIQQE